MGLVCLLRPTLTSSRLLVTGSHMPSPLLPGWHTSEGLGVSCWPTTMPAMANRATTIRQIHRGIVVPFLVVSRICFPGNLPASKTAPLSPSPLKPFQEAKSLACEKEKGKIKRETKKGKNKEEDKKKGKIIKNTKKGKIKRKTKKGKTKRETKKG